METVKVENTKPRLHSISIPLSTSTGKVPQRETVQLKPGMNLVPAEKWEVAKRNSLVAYYLDQGEFIEHGGTDVDSPLKGLSPARACEEIKATLDKGLLRQMRQGEKRPPVLKAIDNQMAEIDRRTKAEKKDE